MLSGALIVLILHLKMVAASTQCEEKGTCPSFQNNIELNNAHRDRPHPFIELINARSSAGIVKFRSLSSRPVIIYVDEPRGSQILFTLLPGGETSTNAYVGVKHFATPKQNTSHVLSRFEIVPNKVLYAIDDPDFPVDKDIQATYAAELVYNQDYLDRTGIPWRHYYGPNGPRPPPVMFMWPANQIGDVHRVSSSQGYWNCGKSSGPSCRQSSEPLQLYLEVVSTHPKVFIIENFLSDYECDEVIKTARARVSRSSVGSHDGGGIRESAARTSSNTWISRSTSVFFDSIYRRVADLLQIDEKFLHMFGGGAAEDIQTVHYTVGQKYDSHYDWSSVGYPESRYITLLLYLTDQEHPYAGGETAFPKGANGKGFKVSPNKRTAVLFYNLLEDGNGDDLALHAAMPVHEGEKWLCNFWVWDPVKR